jgi:hypothetical protein
MIGISPRVVILPYLLHFLVEARTLYGFLENAHSLGTVLKAVIEKFLPIDMMLGRMPQPMSGVAV